MNASRAKTAQLTDLVTAWLLGSKHFFFSKQKFTFWRAKKEKKYSCYEMTQRVKVAARIYHEDRGWFDLKLSFTLATLTDGRADEWVLRFDQITFSVDYFNRPIIIRQRMIVGGDIEFEPIGFPNQLLFQEFKEKTPTKG